MAEIKVNNLQKNFGDFVAVKDSSFTVKDGDFFCLLGPSGCGKTTTLRMIAGLELPTAGEIMLGGNNVTFNRASERDIAFVFQLFALYPHMNVRENIGFPLKCDGVARDEIRRRVEETAQILRITDLLNKPVSSLSGGDRQRVALGRAIVRKPLAFLMDEPLGALDSEFRHVMCGELRALHNRLKATTVYVTHDQLEAMSMADTIAVMNQGVIEQLASPREIYERPASLFVADFIGSPAMNFLDTRAGLSLGSDSLMLDGMSVKIPSAREAIIESDLVLGVRPEHVRLDDSSAIRGEVFGVEYLGTTQVITITTKHGMVRARVDANRKAIIGDHVGLSFHSEKLSVFDKASGRALRSALHEGAIHG
jgi:multiple sugar transport system ATP-binding protein